MASAAILIPIIMAIPHGAQPHRGYDYVQGQSARVEPTEWESHLGKDVLGFMAIGLMLLVLLAWAVCVAMEPNRAD